MSRAIVVSVIVVVAGAFAVGCEDAGYPTTFWTSAGGKGESGGGCPVSDVCATASGPTALISMDLGECSNAPLQKRQETRSSETPEPQPGSGYWTATSTLDNAQNAQCVPSTCFPTSHKGKITIEKENTSYGTCSGVNAPFYWFQGGQELPYQLEVNLETEGKWWGKNVTGRGLVRLEVRRFTNGRRIEPTDESDRYFTGTYRGQVWPGDVVVILPVPDNDDWNNKYYLDDEASYTITFKKQELCTPNSIKKNCNPPDNRPPNALPDLYVKPNSFTATNTSSNTVNFSVTICNRGGSTRVDDKFDVSLYLDRKEPPTCPVAGSADDPDKEWHVTGEVWEGEAFCRTLTDKQHYFSKPVAAVAWVAVDGDCQIKEPEGRDLPADNFEAAPYSTGGLTPPVSRAKLVLREHKVDVTGNKLHYRTEICNEGLLPSNGSTEVRVWQLLGAKPTEGMNNQTHAWKDADIPVLTARGTTGACKMLTWDQTNVPKGKFTARWLIVTNDDIDPDADYQFQYVVETDPAPIINSSGTGATKATKPDLVVKDTTAKQADKGSNIVTFSTTVCNEGTPTEKKALVGLFFDAAEPRCGTSLKYDQEFVLPGGFGSDESPSCMTFSVSVPRPEGSFSASFMADVECSIDEVTRDNNNGNPAPYAVGPGQEAPKTRQEDPNPAANSQSGVSPKPRPQPPIKKEPNYLTAVPEDDEGCSLGHRPGGDLAGLLLVGLIALLLRRRRRWSRCGAATCC